MSYQGAWRRRFRCPRSGAGNERLRHLCNHLPLVQLFQPISRDPVFTLVSPGNLSIDGTGGVGIIPEVDRQQGSQWS
jgi:hypothetical protein